MRKIDLLFGFLIGIITTFIGVFLFITLFTDYDFISGIKGIEAEGKLGKLVTLGAILNFASYFLLLKFNKELMARGIILAVIVLTIVTLLL